MIIFLDELKKILVQYQQPYTIDDWVAYLDPEKQGWSRPRDWKFDKKGRIINAKIDKIYNKIYNLFDECFKWSVFDAKFILYENYIKQEKLQSIILSKFSTFDLFYNPKKMKIENYKIIYLNKGNTQKFKKLKI